MKRNNLAKIIISIILALFCWTFTCINVDKFIVYTDKELFQWLYFITALAASGGICFLGVTKFKMNKAASVIAGISAYLASIFGAMQISILFSDGFGASPYIYFVNVAFYFAFAALALLISGSMRVSAITAIAVSYAFNMASCIVLSLRGTALMPTDIFAWGTAMNVASEYEFKLKYEMITTTILAAAHIMLAFKFPLKLQFKFSPLILRGAAAAVFGAFVLFIALTDFSKVAVVSEYSQYQANMTFGSAFSFYVNTTKMGLEKSSTYNPAELDKKLLSYTQPEAVVTPAAAEQEAAPEEIGTAAPSAESVSPAETASPAEMTAAPLPSPAVRAADDSDPLIKTTLNPNGEKPNIIVIMNESFADLSVINEFKTDEDYMPFFRSLENNAIKGELLVSPFGGYTCNTEYEFLTGMSTGVLHAHSAPYLQMIFSKLPYSLNTHMRRLGYRATAIHPYMGNGWNRNAVYKYLSFDEFVSIENFKKYSEYPERLRGYVSDKGNYSAILNLFYGKDPDEKEFIFNITMQNHGGYNSKKFQKTIHLQDMQGSYPETEQYLSLIKASDDAFKDLVNEFKGYDEPTVIVMFGDHMPNIEKEFYEELYGKSLEDLSMEEALKRYTVPFVIWANYDIQEQTNVKTSPSYLSNLIMETAQLPKSRVQMYLDDLKAEVPQMNPMAYYDAEGNMHPNTDDSKFSEYYDLQYALLKGEKLHYDFNIDTQTYEMFGSSVISPRFIFGKEYEKIKSANP